jgi:hypothetical protein
MVHLKTDCVYLWYLKYFIWDFFKEFNEFIYSIQSISKKEVLIKFVIHTDRRLLKVWDKNIDLTSVSDLKNW